MAELVRFDVGRAFRRKLVGNVDRLRCAMQRAVSAAQQRVVGRKALYLEAGLLARRCEQLSGAIAARLCAKQRILFAGKCPDGAETVHRYSCKTGSGSSESHRL